jgi:hypothetical protein
METTIARKAARVAYLVLSNLYIRFENINLNIFNGLNLILMRGNKVLNHLIFAVLSFDDSLDAANRNLEVLIWVLK